MLEIRRNARNANNAADRIMVPVAGDNAGNALPLSESEADFEEISRKHFPIKKQLKEHHETSSERKV